METFLNKMDESIFTVTPKNNNFLNFPFLLIKVFKVCKTFFSSFLFISN